MEFSNQTMGFHNGKKAVVASVIVLLALATVILGAQYVAQRRHISQLQDQVKKQQVNAQIVTFLQLFIEKVLQANKDVSFEDRLKLENQVRALNDKQVITQWERFVNSKNIEDAQAQVKNLLQLLVNKMHY